MPRKCFALLCATLFVSSCASVQMPDVEVCIDEISGAYCSNTISKQERDVDFNEWEKMRAYRLSMTAKDYGEIKKTLEKLCVLAGNRCQSSVKKTINSMNRSLKRAQY